MAFNPIIKEKAVEVVDEWRSISPMILDTLIEKNITGGETSLKMYDGITHTRMFHLTKGKTIIFIHTQCLCACVRYYFLLCM
jgi:hypothetical protein